jgi:putative flippase GtrA
LIKKELTAFIVVGALTVVVDYLTYRGIVWLSLTGTDIAKGVGFLIGSIFAYFANRFWTFNNQEHSDGNCWRFSSLYAMTLFINVSANSLMLSALAEFPYSIQTGFVIATSLSAILNFIGMKYFVFHEKNISETK